MSPLTTLSEIDYLDVSIPRSSMALQRWTRCLHLKELGLQWNSLGSLTSITEEEYTDKRNFVEPGTKNEDKCLNGTEDAVSPSRSNYASNNSLDSLDSDVSADEQRADNSFIGDGRKFSPFRGHLSVNLQMTFPDPRYLGQRRASTQCIPPPPPTGNTLSDNKDQYRQRRASFQSEAVLTKSANQETNSKIISEMKLNYNFPGPLHAVVRQYGSSSNLSTNKTSPSPSSTPLNVEKTVAKNPLDVLRAWQLEKTKGAANPKTASSSQPQMSTPTNSHGERNGLCHENGTDKTSIKPDISDEAQEGNKNEEKAESLSISQSGIQINKGSNSREDKQLKMSARDFNTSGTEKANTRATKQSSVHVTKEISDSAATFDHIREQSFTSDYYGSIETIHSVQSLPVSRVSSSRYQKSISSDGSPFSDQNVPNNRRHSLPCNSTTQLLSTPSRARNHLSHSRSRAKADVFARKPDSSCPITAPDASLKASLRLSSGNLSCGDDEVFDNTKTTTSFNVQRQQTTHSGANVPGEETTIVRKESVFPEHKTTYHKTLDHELVRNLSASPVRCYNQEVPKGHHLQKTRARTTKSLPDEGYVDSVSSRESSYEDLIRGGRTEIKSLTGVNEETNSDSVRKAETKPADDSHNQSIVKTLLETSL
ncbi:uncharacterized protein LOC117326346 isoform X2 [Pecten maximus]|uniref:uncharacterized protein LOC117326346 isoform X2 n=1 Tax=Pecten maximus TaxID=6579 RepID=UPI00145841B1|nr:uncharacterized protein LOC117326346 isoform X2 [Pecten maximus]